MKINIILIYFFLLIVITKSQIFPANINDLYFEVDSDYMNQVISNLTLFFETYVYLDIAQKPPNSFHSKINITEEIHNIDSSKPKPFYEFFRDIKRKIAKLKDVHIIISPSLNKTKYYYACIPFSFEIQNDTNNEYQLYIKNNPMCFFQYNEEKLKSFLDNSIKENISISSINGKNPFDFLQNFTTEYYNLKNEHSYFTLIIKYISNLPLTFCPLNETELNLTIKLSNGEEETFPYFYFIYENDDLPAINPGDSEIEWNYTANGFKCRVDEANHLNVFIQTTFYYINKEEIMDLMYKCSQLFHSNNYKIVGIESRNIGGLGELGVYLEQLLQPKICKNKMLSALRKNDFIEGFFSNYKDKILDVKTCKNFESFEKFLEEKPDDYGDDIKHYRTKIFDEITLDMKLDLHKKREEFINSNKTKKPTDIIIFTDYQSISATSIFLKGFQQTGGAIVVGYFGNPKKNAIHDSSVSSSGSYPFTWATPFINLNKLGFDTSLTTNEMYSYDYQGENPIPQEYISYPVDDHVDIYEEYSDSVYQKFIDAANNIFEKYDKKCNKDNKLLLLEDNNCFNLKGVNHAHGGYRCGDNGEWNTKECQAFYCDLGYYFDTYQKKCIEDLCTKNDSNSDNPEEDDNTDNYDDSDDKNDDDDGFPTWALLIIIVGGFLIILIIIIFVIIKCRKKSHESLESSSKNIEDVKLMENY